MRARNIKPSLFKNEILGAADPLYTLIFEGLWCMADRDGRLEDRPLKIHIECSPLRGHELTSRALEWLHDNGFILRYEAGGVRYIQVVKFLEHQNPHPREAQSVIPPPDGWSSKPRNGQGNAKDLPSPSDSPFLIPDPPSLIPEEEAAAFDLTTPGQPKDLDLQAEYAQFAAWCADKGKTPTRSLWLKRAAKWPQYGYAKLPKTAPTDADIRAARAQAMASNKETLKRVGL